MGQTSQVQYSIVDQVRQSPPLDLSKPTDETWLDGKTIVITGGASGFGAGFFRKWARAGATVIVGDINVDKGDKLVREVRKETGNPNLHFHHCDVTDWRSQVQFFKDALKQSPHGGIDTVVANAGVIERNDTIDKPEGLDAADPPPPNLNLLEVNLKGVLYTVHLALYHLARNPGSVPASPNNDPASIQRDRHLILVASMAGLAPLPSQTMYSTSKHAVVGLYRSLRASSFMHGVRTNLLCPYFVDTPLFTAGGRALIAGCPMGTVEDVVEAATMFAANPRIVGRALAVGPKVKVEPGADGLWTVVEKQGDVGVERGFYEVYAYDFEDTEVFTRKIVGIYNRVMQTRGWLGWARDVLAAIRYGLGWQHNS